MLTRPATAAMREAWRGIAARWRPRLTPNRKTGAELNAYLIRKYPLCPLTDPLWEEILREEMKDRYPDPGRAFSAKAYRLPREGSALTLYRHQEPVFKGMDITVAMELATGVFHVEGSAALWDELFAFRGLDEEDLKNDYLVAEYIQCTQNKRFL